LKSAPTKSSVPGAGAIDLLEEAAHLLRGAPAGLYGLYALGTLPCVLAFLFFWADMSRGAYAREHAEIAAAGMALLFLWMKCWQAVFADGLLSRLSGRAQVRWTFSRAGLLALTQTALQPSALFAVPLAVVVMLPFPWVFSFYQNLTAQGGQSRGLGDSCRAAARQSATRPGQCALLLALLAVFTFFVWLNVVVTMACLPYLLKTFLGVENAFTQASWRSVANTTYLACSFGLTYVCVDPLIKAVFALRCFYGQSIQTGDDLKSELARLRAAASPSLAAVALLVLLLVASPLPAQSPPTPPTQTVAPAASFSTSELDKSIEKVLQRSEFAWRMPREEVRDKPSERTNWFARAIGAVVDILRDVLEFAFRGLGRALRWIGDEISRLWPNPGSPSNPAGGVSGWQSALQILLLVLIVAIAAFLAVLVLRLWRRRRRPREVVAEAVVATPDLNDENVAADQLPEDEWLRIAREMMTRGNYRLALRAYYLAGLAHLAAREMIAIAIFKSNREYESELVRKARALPEVQSAFSQNVTLFDRVWYGLHEVTQEGLAQFQSNLERIRAC
jgi:hypothetical protein